MKPQKNNTIRRIAAAILTFAIAMTGVSLDATAAQAAYNPYADYLDAKYAGMEDIKDLHNTTVTMKVGDTKIIYYKNEYKPGRILNDTKYYDWSSSDETVVSMTKGFEYSCDGINENLSDLTLTAEKAGTAVITAYCEKTDGTSETLSFTIVVEGQKMTAKQKKCSHKFKTTKKATCDRSGMKTCKKCHLQKTIAKKGHKFETNYETQIDIPKYVVYYCPFCDGTFDPYDYGSTGPLDQGGDLEKNKAADKAAKDAYLKHLGKCENEHPDSPFSASNQTIAPGMISTGSWWYLEANDYAHATKETVPVTRCVHCKLTKEDIEKYS